MTARVVADGKHLSLDGAPFRIRGVTYGSFLPRLTGEPFPERAQVKQDFREMVNAGINTVRTYEVPPVDLLETAEDCGLRLLVGIQYDDWRMEPSPGRAAHRRVRDAGRREIDRALERCHGREHVIGIAVGNEVPADVVRVHGIAGVEDHLSELVAEIHAGSDHLLATYVNFPTTEYLAVEKQDLICFNVFLEDTDALRRYLRHLQVIAGASPLVVTELGLASELHGDVEQAESLAQQLRVVDETGCAGASVFAWTDDWGVAGQRVEGWGFGITTTERKAKPALAAVREWANGSVADLSAQWPRVSVVVCAYNEEQRIAECLESLTRSTYPDLEVVVCDDGSTDRTLAIAREFPFRVLALPHGGLSRARNAGIEATTGEVVAYLDADAYCHPEWPFHLVLSLDDESVAATGGPNLPVADAGFVERAVALSPGAPLEVLVSDDRAEHVPGCNMAFRRDDLTAIGGFDPTYTSAGDDVDVCWKLLERGRNIAFAHAAQVRHHRRATVQGYLKQQRGYGAAEKLLTGAHPHRFNRLGQARWAGVIYGGARILPSMLRPVLYHGYQGASPFQTVARRRAEAVNMWLAALLPATLPLALAGLVLGAAVSPWFLVLPAVILVAMLGYGAAVAASVDPPRGEPQPARLRLTVGALHVLQPNWRAFGRLVGRRATVAPLAHPAWSGNRWTWLRHLESYLRARGCSLRTGTPSRSWDLEAAVGPFVAARITTAVMWSWEPHFRVQYRARPAFFVAAAVAAACAALTPLGWIALGGLVLVSVGELFEVRRRITNAIRTTTLGADA